MSEQLFDDLGAWEAGELALADLERRHPGEPVLGLTALHGSLAAVLTEPVPDEAAGWITVQERMDVRRPASSPRVRHALVGALVAAVLSASAAFAAPGAFHAVVDGVRHGVHAVFGANRGEERSPVSGGPSHGHGAGRRSSIAAGSNGGSGPSPGGSDDSTRGDGSHDGGSGSGDQGSGDQGSGDQGSGSGDQGSGSGSGDRGTPNGAGDQGSGD